MRIRGLGVLSLFVPALFTTPSRADLPPGTVPLIVHGDRPGLRFELERASRGASGVVVRCAADCTMMVYPGAYRLRVAGGDDVAEGARKIDVVGPVDAFVEPRSESTRSLGLVLGITGPVLMVAGALGMAYAITGAATDRADSGTGPLLATSAVGMLGGVALTPIGWVMFARSAPAVTLTPLAYAAARPALRFSPFVGSSGLGVGGELSF